MGKRTLVLAVALILAAVSAFSVWQYLSNIEDDVRRDIDEVRVYRATQFIETGTTGSEAELVIEESIALAEVVDPADGPVTNIMHHMTRVTEYHGERPTHQVVVIG